MKNMGTFDPNWKPVIKGGLSDKDKARLLAAGWKMEVTGYDVKDADVGFAETDVPGGFLLYKVNIPAGTEYFYNPETGAAMLTGCGNPTCWRYLMR